MTSRVILACSASAWFGATAIAIARLNIPAIAATVRFTVSPPIRNDNLVSCHFEPCTLADPLRPIQPLESALRTIPPTPGSCDILRRGVAGGGVHVVLRPGRNPFE